MGWDEFERCKKMPGEKIAKYMERFGKAYEAMKAICTRNLPSENPVQEPHHGEGTAERHNTDCEKNEGEEYLLDTSWEDTEHDEGQNTRSEGNSLRQRGGAPMKGTVPKKGETRTGRMNSEAIRRILDQDDYKSVRMPWKKPRKQRDYAAEKFDRY